MILSHKFNLRASIWSTSFVLFLLVSCSPNQNSFTSNIYHNLTAHYNGYYYANEGILTVSKTLKEGLDDDHNLLLRLFPKLDTTLAKSYAKETEEVIKMASISIQRHPNSRWVYKNYILVGVARLYDCNFQDAIQTFKYVNTKSNDPDIRHEALIHLIRTFAEQGEYNKADETIDFLSKEKLSKKNQKQFYLEQAYLGQIREDYDKMVQNLTKADPLLEQSDHKGRIYFIIGQVYQKLGFEAEAFNYYKKCLTTNPEYEIDFFARVNMAQVTSNSDPNNSKDIRKQLSKMLNDEKNLEFKDKIYFEIGAFEFKQGNLTLAMTNFRNSLRVGNSQRIKGTSYLRLGQIYYDTLKKFDLAKSYYDSAVNSLPPDTENLNSIKKLQSVLADFVTYTSTIQIQDSLLMLSQMDTSMLRKMIDSVKTRKIAENSINKSKKRRSVDQFETERSTSTFSTQEVTTTNDWYFANLSAVSIGQTEFQRIWGNIKLEDNWRRSVKATATVEDNVLAITKNEEFKAGEMPSEGNLIQTNDPFLELYNQLPKTKEQIDTAYAKIERSYLKLGDLYYFRLEEKSNAFQTYQKLLQRFPNSKFAAETLYKSYLASKELNYPGADKFKSELTTSYPNSTFARLLINPNYLAENTATIDRQKEFYRQAFNEYSQGNFIASVRSLNSAESLGLTEFIPQIRLLRILITGKTEDVTIYQFELDEFIKKYPDHHLKSYAEKLLEASKTVLQEMEKEKGIRFIRDLNAPHQVIVIHNRSDNLSTLITDKIEKFNLNTAAHKSLTVSNLVLDENLTVTMILEFVNVENTRKYIEQLKELFEKNQAFINYKFDIFAITKENLAILYRTKALREYIAFYDRNY